MACSPYLFVSCVVGAPSSHQLPALSLASKNMSVYVILSRKTLASYYL
jgi:hypothetical protein